LSQALDERRPEFSARGGIITPNAVFWGDLGSDGLGECGLVAVADAVNDEDGCCHRLAVSSTTAAGLP